MVGVYQSSSMQDRLKMESWRVQKLGEKSRYTWDDAGYKWLMETEHKRTHQADIKQLAWIQ